MKHKITVGWLLLFTSTALFAQDRDISYMSSGGKLKPLQANMDILHYTLSLDVDIPNQSINGYTEIDLNVVAPTDTLLFDLVHFLDVTGISANKKKKTFYRDGDLVYIVDAAGFKQAGNAFKLNTTESHLLL